MKKAIICGTVLAALLALSTVVSAAEPAVVAHHGGGRGNGRHHNQTTTQTCVGAECANFLDENDDGICDYHVSGGRHQRCGGMTA